MFFFITAGCSNHETQIEKAHIMDEVKRANVANLNPPFTESQLIHKLIAQYLAHDGYVETARAFATEVQSENDALTGATSGQNALELEEDRDAVNRQSLLSPSYSIQSLTTSAQKSERQYWKATLTLLSNTHQITILPF
jgi:hypothetical protein